MDPKMFCYQCQETAGCKGCTIRGVCGKSPEVAAMQDLLVYVTRGLSAVTSALRAKGELDVAKQVAIPFGGGGHAKAAGCTLALPIDSALESVLKQAEKALNV